MAPAKMATFSRFERFAGFASAMVRQISIMVMKSIIEQPESSPSRPSSRFEELTVPTMMNIITGMYSQPRFHSTLKKGTVSEEPMVGCLYAQTDSTAASTSCGTIFCMGVRPRLRLSLTLMKSSTKPTRPKPSAETTIISR